MKTSFLLAAFFISFSALADWSKIPSKDFTLSPPPVEGSAEYIQDFLALHDYQDNRTQAQCDEAFKMESINIQAYYSPILSKSDLNESKTIVNKALKIGERISVFFKEKFQRPRPYNTDKTLKPCITKPGGSKAYPSGHAMRGAVSACVLAIIYPADATQIMEYGARFGEMRILGGVHHPSDVAASQKLALQICERLEQEPDFLKDVKAIH